MAVRSVKKEALKNNNGGSMSKHGTSSSSPHDIGSILSSGTIRMGKAITET